MFVEENNSNAHYHLSINFYREHFREVWKNDQSLFEALFPVLRNTKNQYPTDIFFLEVIPVTPPRFRPVDFTNGVIKENGRSMVLKKIIQDAEILKTALVAYKLNSADSLPVEAQRLINVLQGSTLLAKLHFAWEELQQSVILIVDTSAQKDSVGVGFKQVISKMLSICNFKMSIL